MRLTDVRMKSVKNTLFIVLLVLLLPLSGAFPEIVDSAVAKELTRIFPELENGYIDLNRNGKPDQDDELNEVIPESSVKDSLIQGQEILDFIIENYKFLPLEKLSAVRGALEGASGVIPELVSLNYLSQIEDVLEKKEQLDAHGLFLTASARREALNRIDAYIGTMVNAYKKEDREFEGSFIEARDRFFTMIEQGYPLPDSLEEKDRGILVVIMINTIIKNAEPDGVSVAIKTLGRLKADSATSYLLKLMQNPSWTRESIKALGRIGDSRSLDPLLQALEKETDKGTRVDIIKAIGGLEGQAGLSRLKALARPAKENEPGSDIDIVAASLEAMAEVAGRGNQDPSLMTLFTDYLAHPEPRMRILSIKGLANFRSRQTGSLLLPLLRTEKRDEVKKEIILALDKLQFPGTALGLIGLLRSAASTDDIRQAAITALGDSSEGNQAVPVIIGNLSSSNPEVSGAAAGALIKLDEAFPKLVVPSLSKSLFRETDKSTLESGARVLAYLADETSLNTLTALLSSPYPEVKTHATWGLYRIRSATNPKAVDELNKLVSNESEPLQVRINAVRALGAIRYDSERMNVWETLLNITKLRSEKYHILRYYALWALGELGDARAQVFTTLAGIAQRDDDAGIRLQAVRSIQKLATKNARAEAGLIKLFRQSQDNEVRITIVEALADMSSANTAELAAEILGSDLGPQLGGANLGGATLSGAGLGGATTNKKRVIYALSKLGGEREIRAILDAARDGEIKGYVEMTLEDIDPDVLSKIVRKRLKTETDPSILSVMESLQSRMDEAY